MVSRGLGRREWAVVQYIFKKKKEREALDLNRYLCETYGL